MSERFPDEVLQRAMDAYDSRYRKGADHALSIAAMRAVLEGHLAEQEPTVPLDTLTSVTVSGARAFWALKDLEKRHEALRVAVMIEVSHGPEADWPAVRLRLGAALNEPPAASDGSPR